MFHRFFEGARSIWRYFFAEVATSTAGHLLGDKIKDVLGAGAAKAIDRGIAHATDEQRRRDLFQVVSAMEASDPSLASRFRARLHLAVEEYKDNRMVMLLGKLLVYEKIRESAEEESSVLSKLGGTKGKVNVHIKYAYVERLNIPESINALKSALTLGDEEFADLLSGLEYDVFPQWANRQLQSFRARHDRFVTEVVEPAHVSARRRLVAYKQRHGFGLRERDKN